MREGSPSSYPESTPNTNNNQYYPRRVIKIERCDEHLQLSHDGRDLAVYLHRGDGCHALLHRGHALPSVGVLDARLNADRISWHFAVDFHSRPDRGGEEQRHQP